jgi:hypothetical protein
LLPTFTASMPWRGEVGSRRRRVNRSSDRGRLSAPDVS